MDFFGRKQLRFQVRYLDITSNILQVGVGFSPLQTPHNPSQLCNLTQGLRITRFVMSQILSVDLPSQLLCCSFLVRSNASEYV